ncbi:uncharacterized protein HKW66_Vig0178100 [Vigna angularis]|uniref:Ubiquitin-like protease family profile domain-containing protein n=1 Tax=Phaseolus angularis TaxID=3914 RepID=A0A8T0JYE6_PHAAN|nr:uncharacterized protein HKW66_Vig0178100 [Vigna angularis]
MAFLVFPNTCKVPYKDGDFNGELSTLNLTFTPMLLIVDALEKDNVAMVWWIQLYNYVYTSSGLLAAGVLVYVGVERVSRENRFACEVNMMSSVHHENLVKMHVSEDNAFLCFFQFIGACKDPLMVIVIEMLPEWQCLHVLWALERLSLHGYSSHRKFPCIWIWCSFTSKTKKIVVLFQTGDVNLDWYVSKHDKGHEAIQAAFHLDEKVKAKGCSVEEERNAKSDDDICEDDVAVEEAGGSGIERVVIEIDDDVVVVDDEGDDYNVPFVVLFATAIFMYFEKRSYGVVKKILFSPLYGVENLEGFFGIMYNRPEWRIGPLVVEQANISSQPNLHNCGVIMLKAMEMWDGKEKYNG